ncbi:MAG: hypothetical protein QGG42_15730 [Phycisphaerae bacterium]|jgi:hypothetical protein|nr:hypothetical protein [Phycisphaerae bacterium]
MKSILTLIVLSATFLFGYDMGRAEDSPDIVGWLKVKSVEAYDMGKDLIAAVSDKPQDDSGYGELDE